jgi:hypothetical protein
MFLTVMRVINARESTIWFTHVDHQHLVGGLVIDF